MTDYEIRIEDKVAPQDLEALWQHLYKFNFGQTGQRGQFISCFLRDRKGQILGGAHGWTAFGWLHIDVLWLTEDLRRKGLGRRVLEVTEQEARRRGCKFAELDTFSFQSLGFYLKSGYTVFGELDNIAGEHRWYFLKKEL
jgi:GNAT superfamily N-acetyltransferase